MADALRKTLAGLRALAADHRSGAAEIAERATALLEEFCRQERADDSRLTYALGELAETVLNLQPSMAPLLNLANLIQLAAEQDNRPLRNLRAALEKFRRQRQQATAKIAGLFAARIRRHRTVLTYSYSSTVLAALTAAARSGTSQLQRVVVSESRPLYEGRLLAERLSAQGVAVTLVVDAALPELVDTADVVAVGADAVLECAYVNRLGTRLLQERARTARKPFFLLADTAKFLPPLLARFHRIEDRPPQEVWRDAPERVTVFNPYFETIPLERRVTLLSERGVMPPARLRAWVKRQEVARRWSEATAEGQP